MKFSSLNGGEDGEYNGIGFIEIVKICATQDTFFFGMASIECVWMCECLMLVLAIFGRERVFALQENEINCPMILLTRCPG